MEPFKMPDFSAIALPYHPPVAITIAKEQAALARRLNSGDSLFAAMIKAVEELVKAAPPEHDILVEALGVYVTNVEFMEPHTFLFHGHDNNGNKTSAVAHYSQVVCRVVYAPKRGPEKILTGFSRVHAPA